LLVRQLSLGRIDMNEKSPGGSMFPYYYKGGEIHCLKYGSFFADEEALMAVMKAEEDFIARRNRSLSIWVDFYETQLTDAVMLKFMESMKRLSTRIVKLAIVGCSSRDRRRMKRMGKQTGNEISVSVRYFRDPEDAKTWLVGKSL